MSDNTDWMLDGNCTSTDPEIFFPVNMEQQRAATKICFDCPVRILCANYAIDTVQEFGVWGGLTEADRKQLRSRKTSRAGISNKLT